MKSEHMVVLIDNGQWNVLDVWQDGNALHEDVQAVPDEGSNISFVEWETGTVMEVERKKQQREKMSTALLYLKQVGTGKENTEKRFYI